jgi:hypothetical protein
MEAIIVAQALKPEPRRTRQVPSPAIDKNVLQVLVVAKAFATIHYSGSLIFCFTHVSVLTDGEGRAVT